MLYLILGGAAVYRCNKCIVLNPALAAEGVALAHGRIFPQAVSAVPLSANKNEGSPCGPGACSECPRPNHQAASDAYWRSEAARMLIIPWKVTISKSRIDRLPTRPSITDLEGWNSLN